MTATDILTHKPLFDSFAAKDDCAISCCHFSSIFAWQDFFQFTFEAIDGRMCVFAHQHGEAFLYMPPLGGTLEASTLEKCFQRMGKSRLARVENIYDKQLPTVSGKEYNSRHKADEYVYRKADVAMLQGNAYKSQRHDVNLAIKEHAPVIEMYRPAHYQGCVALYKRWAAQRAACYDDTVYLSMLEDNAQVHALVISHAKALGLTGRVVTVDGSVAGYTFGYALNLNTFCVLFEVTDLTKQGLAAFMFSRFCADEAWSNFEFVNAMDDFGMPNVKRAKEAFHPAHTISLFTVTQHLEK